MILRTKYVTLFIVILILLAGCLPVSSPVNITTSTEPVIATTTSTPTADIMGSDGAVQGWAVLAERDNYDGLNMQNLPMDYIDILQMHRLLLDMGWQESHIHEIREFGRNDLVQELDWLAENAGPDDLVFVYVVAHGSYLRDLVRWSSFFGREWAEIPSHRQILLVDSCKAAEFTNAISMWGDPEPFISIAGVDADEYGWAGVEEEGLPILGSIFTHYFALAFKDPQADLNSDGRVSVQEAVRLAEAQQRSYMHDVVLAVPTFVVGYHDLNFYPEKDPGFPHVVVKDTIGEPVFLQLDRR